MECPTHKWIWKVTIPDYPILWHLCEFLMESSSYFYTHNFKNEGILFTNVRKCTRLSSFQYPFLNLRGLAQSDYRLYYGRSSIIKQEFISAPKGSLFEQLWKNVMPRILQEISIECITIYFNLVTDEVFWALPLKSIGRKMAKLLWDKNGTKFTEILL